MTSRSEDPLLDDLSRALDKYKASHPETETHIYRRNPGSIRLRIVGRQFEGMTRTRRHDQILGFLREQASPDAIAEISLLLAIPPSELGASLANHEFEHPSPSHPN